MKKISTLILFLGFTLVFSQNHTSSINKTLEIDKTPVKNSIDSLNGKIDTPAVYPGGVNAFRRNFSNTFNPSKLNLSKQLKSELRFLIDENGYITKVIVNGNDKSLNKEMERTIKAMSKTKWEPAKNDGKNVQYWQKLPITMNNH